MHGGVVSTVNVGELELVEMARVSRAYQALLTGLPANKFESLRELHDTLASTHQVTKELCFNSTNITSANYFGSPYRGMTSGRSGAKKQYYKSAEWVVARDNWRKYNLSKICGGAYSVINICSRLFPHDSFDITIAAASLDHRTSQILAQIVESLMNLGVRIIYRGFPSQLIRNLSNLKKISDHLQLKPLIITTGMAPTDHEFALLRKTFDSDNIFQEYGAQDLGIQLFSCRQCGGYHSDNPRCLLSIIDGKIYSSDLFSKDQPVIGCYTGDLAVACSELCSTTGQKGFHIKQIPRVTSTLPGNTSNSLNRTMVGQFDILLATNADPMLVEARDKALDGGRNNSNASNFSLDRIQERLKNHEFTLLRLDLNQSLAAAKRLEWQKKQLSLVSFLLAHSMILDDVKLSSYIFKWQEINASSHELISYAQDIYRSISSSDTYTTIEVFMLTSEIIKFVLTSVSPTEYLLNEPALINRLDSLWQSIQRDGSLPKCCAITEAIKPYILSFVWLKYPYVLDDVLSSFAGTANYNILFVEYLQSAGCLLKN